MENTNKYYAGIDIGGTKIAFGVVDENRKLLISRSIPAGAGRPFEVIVKEMADTVKIVAADAGIGSDRIAGVGIGVPSTVDPKTGRVVFANNLGWRDLDLTGEFRKHWDIPVYLENDADCAALAESMEGPAAGKNVLVITIGTGFGGGLILNGRIFKGGDNSGFEPGHSALVFEGEHCTCGLRGCTEAYTSVTALIRQTREKMEVHRDSLMWRECGGDLEKVDGKTSFCAAKKGDAAAGEVVRDYIEYVSAGIANLVSLFRPQMVIIGGAISAEGDYLLEPLRKSAGSRIYAAGILPMPPLQKARLGNDAGIIGAALLGAVPPSPSVTPAGGGSTAPEMGNAG
ncbi:MAG: ROK family protein [Spirochaetaceae bacterium]|jgi:glucokinase|nr:ROK family protein [Spirochaetaceae bacterium]